MAGLPKADELLEVARHELAAPVGDDLRPGLGVSLAAPLQDDLRVSLLHGGANIPTDNVTRAAIQHTAQIVKGRCDVDEREVDMPMLMGPMAARSLCLCARIDQSDPGADRRL